MVLANFIGTWRSQDFPMHYFGDQIEITLHISGNLFGTLWILDEKKKSKTLAKGKVSLNPTKDDKFEIVLDGVAIEDKFLILSARMFMPNVPPSFLIEIPDYGERYFQKIV